MNSNANVHYCRDFIFIISLTVRANDFEINTSCGTYFGKQGNYAQIKIQDKHCW